MTLELAEIIVRWAGGLLAYITLATLLYGVWRGTQRESGRTIGSLFIYFTWTTVFLACFAPLTMLRAWREEKVLAAEFGQQWQEYRQRVPMFVPRLNKKG